MERYQDKAPLRSNIAQPNLLQASQRRNLNATTQGAQGVLGSLSNFFDKVGAISDEFGKQNAQIQGENEAQANTVEWLKATDTKKELETTLSNPNLTEQQRQLATHELLVVDDNINTYISATKKSPSINVKDIAMQRTQSKLFRTNLSNQYTDMTSQAYETFIDDPKGFEEATQKLTKDFMKTLPDDIIGDALTGFKNVNSQMASKVHQNYIAKQNDIMIADSKKNIDESIDFGTKFAYAGGDYSVQVKNIIDSYSILYQKRLITKEQYAFQTDKIEKEFKTQQFMGKFDRLIGFDAEHKFVPNASKIKAGYEEIDNFSNTILQHKEGESLAAYQLRTANLNQDEVNGIVKSMRVKLSKAETALKASNKLAATAYTNMSKESYKMMWKGVKPDNYEQLKKEAYVNGDQETFDEAVLAMEKVQATSDMDIEEKKAYTAEYNKSKKTGVSEMDYKINTVVQKNVKADIALAAKDPNQLAVNDGIFKSLLKMQDANGQSDFGAILNELKFRATDGKNKMFAKYETNGKSLLSHEEALHFAHVISSNPSQAPQIIRSVYGSVGSENANKIFKDMYPKKSNGIIYSAVISSEKPVVSDNIILGIDAEKNGAKLTTDDEKSFNDYIRSDTTLATLGKSANGIRQAIRGYYFNMPEKNMEEAVQAVTNGIDNGIIVYKQGLDYDDVYNNMVGFTDRWNSGYKSKFKSRLNGVPSIQMDTFVEALQDDEYKLVSVSQTGYAFKTKDMGTFLTNNKGKKLVFNFKKGD